MAPADPPIPSVSPEEAEALREQGALLVDVREQAEWDEARIPGAVLEPMSRLHEWWQRLPRDRTVVLYCRTGARSGQICQALASQAGFDNVLDLEGGIVAWDRAGLPVEGSAGG